MNTGLVPTPEFRENFPSVMWSSMRFASRRRLCPQMTFLDVCHLAHGDPYGRTKDEQFLLSHQEVLGICQNKSVRLGDAIGWYCRIQITSEDKTLRSPLVAGVWRAQILWVDQAWRVFLVSLYSNLFTSGSLATKRFLCRVLWFSSLITYCHVILGLLFFYPLPFSFQHCTYLFIHAIVECFD